MLWWLALGVFPCLCVAKRRRGGKNGVDMMRPSLGRYVGRPFFIGDPNILGVEVDQLRPTQDEREHSQMGLQRAMRVSQREMPIGAFMADADAETWKSSLTRRRRRRRN